MLLDGSPSLAAYLAHLRNDFLKTGPAVPYRVLFRNGHIHVHDAYGVLMRMGGIYLEPVDPPITDPGQLKHHGMPDFTKDAYYGLIRRTRLAYPELCLCGSV